MRRLREKLPKRKSLSAIYHKSLLKIKTVNPKSVINQITTTARVFKVKTKMRQLWQPLTSKVMEQQVTVRTKKTMNSLL